MLMYRRVSDCGPTPSVPLCLLVCERLKCCHAWHWDVTSLEWDKCPSDGWSIIWINSCVRVCVFIFIFIGLQSFPINVWRDEQFVFTQFCPVFIILSEVAMIFSSWHYIVREVSANMHFRLFIMLNIFEQCHDFSWVSFQKIFEEEDSNI